MSKAGDVIVKLILKSDEYEKGLKKGRNSTEQFASAVTKGVAGVIAKFTAIVGAVTLVIGAIAKLSKSNQTLSDAWGRLTSSMSASWDLMLKKVANLDFSHLIRDMRDVARTAREAYDALDAMGEIGTAYNISLARQAKEIALLKTDLRDMTKSDEERIAAGEKLLDIYRNLEQEPTRGLGNVMDTTLDKYLTQMGYQIAGQSDEVMKSVRQQFIDLFVWLGTEEGETASSAMQNAIRKGYGFMDAMKKDLAAQGLSQQQIYFLEKYNKMLNDDDRTAIEKAVVDYYKQEAHYNEEVLRIQTQINSLKAHTTTGGTGGSGDGASAEELQLQAMKDMLSSPLATLAADGMSSIAQAMTMPDLITDDWLARQEEQTRKFENMLEKVNDISVDFSQAIQSGVVAGINELANAVSAGESIDAGAMVSALLSPLADACIAAGLLIMTTGEGIEALRDTLLTGLVTGGMSAIAAGALLMGVGAAAKVGLAAIASGSKGAGSTGSLSTASSGAGTGTGAENVEMTVHIEGLVIKGSDLVLATDRARAELGR